MTTNFLWCPGSSNNGLLTPAFNLMTTELESVASAGVAVSSVGGSSGLFTNLVTAQGILADLFLYVGNPSVTATAGASWSGWFLTSPDAGTTLEGTGLPPRPPDFVIPVFAGATSTSNPYKSQGVVVLPALAFKVLMQNNMGVASSAGGTTAPYLKCAPYAMQY